MARTSNTKVFFLA
jgi:hypothetical protein